MQLVQKYFKKTYLLILLILLILTSCRPIIHNNKVNNLKEGKWVEIDTLDFIYKTVGNFKKNKLIGTWKYYNNNSLIRKEKYEKEFCKTKFYYLNRSLERKGYTKMILEDSVLHWFYIGKWHFYDNKRKLIKTKMIINGIVVDSLNLK